MITASTTALWAWQMAALCHDHNAVVLAVIIVVLQQCANMIDVDFELRNQDNMSPASGPRRIGNPSGVAAHHFDDDHAVVRIGRGVNAIDSLGGNRYCCVEAECYIGAADVVVDGLGNAHAWHAVFA